MKNRLCIILFFTGIIFLTTGCQSTPPQSNTINFEYLTNPGFPTVFFGTWVREGPSALTSTRTFTTNTYRISTQQGYWVLEGVSGDTYTIAQYDKRENKAAETIRYVNGKLIISPCGGDGENQCGGTWVRQ